MKFLKKALAVSVSLALCGSLVAPSFAASFTELQTVIDTQISLKNEDDGSIRIGYDNGNVTLNEDVTREDKEQGITIKGSDVTIDLNGHDIDGNGKAGSVITVKGEDTSLTVTDTSEEKDGSITGGNGTLFGGGIYVSGGASVTLENGSISENKATANGGGVYVDSGSFTMNGGTISDNNGGNVGGGVYVNTQAAQMQGNKATFEMNGGEISNNTAVSGGGVGAGSIDKYNNTGDDRYAAIDINGGSITGNTAATGDGGGVWAQHNTVEISNADISGNTAGNIGGGVYLGMSDTTITDSTVTGNKVTGSNDVGSGGIYVGGGTAEITGTEVSSNSSATNAGGIGVNGNLTLTDVAIKDNHADSGRGGGIYAGNYGNLTVNGGEISENSAKLGGGMFTFSNPAAGLIMKVTVDGTKISGNPASQYAGGIYVFNGAEFTVNNGTISGNTATVGGGVFTRSDAKFTMNGGELYGNTATSFAADLYSDKNSSVTLMDISGLGLEMEDGTPITGWLLDGNPRWDAESDANVKYESLANYTGNLCLKAAHDKFYNVSYMDGETVLQTNDLEKGQDIPGFEGTLTRPGYTFGGWLVGGEDFDPATGTVDGDLVLVALWIQNPEVVDPAEPDVIIDDPAVPLGDEPEVEIDDPAVPLSAGPVTRAQFVDYLWRHEGEPEADAPTFTDVPADHEYAPAIGWAQSIGIIDGQEFQPDELVTGGDVRTILARFAEYAGMTMPELTTLTDDDDEAVLNCDQVLAEFFDEEYVDPSMEDAA